MSRDLFRADLPVVISSRPGEPPSASKPSLLQAVLTLSPTASLSFTLSDLRERLFIASFDLTAGDYPAVRAAQSLQVDFSAFPHRVADLLRRPSSDPTYSAHLVLPPGSTDDTTVSIPTSASAPTSASPSPSTSPSPHTVTFSIFQTNNFKLLPHLDLTLTLSPPSLLRRALADAAASATAARDEAQTSAAAATARADAAELQLDDLRPDAAAAPGLRRDLAARDAALAAANADLAALRPAAADADALRAELRSLRAAADAAAAERDAARADALAVAKERDAEAARAKEAELEVRKARRAVERVQSVAAAVRRRARVAEAVVERQETVVEREEKRAAAAERELRRAGDREEMLVVERDGMAARLEAAKEKIEEAEAMQASNQQVIAYLNRELNSRAIARQQASHRSHAGAGGGRRGRRLAPVGGSEGELGDIDRSLSGQSALYIASSSTDSGGGGGAGALVVGNVAEAPRGAGNAAGSSALAFEPSTGQGAARSAVS